jgi:hypothetical protein
MSYYRREMLNYLDRIDRARMAAESRGEEFDENDYLRRQASEERMAALTESDEFKVDDFKKDGFQEHDDWDDDGFDEDTSQSLDDDDGFEEEPEDEEDSLDEECAEEEEQDESRASFDESNDTWAENDHKQRSRKGGGGSLSNGLRQAEQAYGDFYDFAHLGPEDGHGISVPRPSVMERPDSEKVFRRPESDEEAHEREMERLSRRYELNDGVDEPVSIADFEEDIVRQLDELRTDFYASGAARSHYERKQNDSRYSDSAECERNELLIDADDRLDWFEERKKKDPSGNDLRIDHLDSIMEGLDDVGSRRNKERAKKEEFREMLENGEISQMTYDDAIQAIDCFSQRGKTVAGYKAISGGDSMYDDVGEIMDEENNMFDDIYASNAAEIQDARQFIGGLPREVAERCLDYGVELGVLSEDQMNHVMAMAARPAYSTRRQPSVPPKKKKKWFGW